jgi:7-dehydrocholesterol reductase
MTIQSNYILKNNVDLLHEYFISVLIFGLLSFYVFRSANNQKILAQSTNGYCIIWGLPCTFVRTNYIDSDGKLHGSLLLTSGYWQISRHFSSFPEILYALAICASCAEGNFIAYVFVFYMLVTLKNRIDSEEERSKKTYGIFWKRYCDKVPYKVIPNLY